MNQALIAFERVGLSQNYINWIDYKITLNFNKIKTNYYIIFKQLKPPLLYDGLPILKKWSIVPVICITFPNSYYKKIFNYLISLI